MVSTLHVYVGQSVMSIRTQYIRFSGLLYYSELFFVLKPIFSIVRTYFTISISICLLLLLLYSKEPSTFVN